MFRVLRHIVENVNATDPRGGITHRSAVLGCSAAICAIPFSTMSELSTRPKELFHLGPIALPDLLKKDIEKYDSIFWDKRRVSVNIKQNRNSPQQVVAMIRDFSSCARPLFFCPN